MVECPYHTNERTVNAFWTIDIFVMSEDGKFVEMVLGLFEMIKITQHGLAAAAIKQVLGFERFVHAGGIFDVDLHAVGSEGKLLYLGLLENLSAVLSRMIKKEFVELGPGDLIRAVPTRAEPILEIKFCVSGSASCHDLSAVFRQESTIEFFADAEAVESLDAEWQERFTDVKARKLFSLEDDHAPARLRQKGRGRAAGWSPANDGDIVHVGLHLVSMIANSSDFGRDNAPRYPGRRVAPP